MRILIVCSGNTIDGEVFNLEIHQAFIFEQVKSLERLDFKFDFFLINRKGITGYLSHIFLLRKRLTQKYDLIHAHGGLCGFVANTQFKVPVVTTYHGSDINIKILRWISYFSILRSSKNIFVSRGQCDKTIFKRNYHIIPCGVDTKLFVNTISESLAANESGKKEEVRILFGSAFNNPVKNYSLVQKAIDILADPNIRVIELKAKSRREVAELLNYCHVLIMTSLSEGSPQVIKEAMSCNCPICSTDVGDIKEIIGDTEGCFLTDFKPESVAESLNAALKYTRTNPRTKGRDRIFSLGLDSESIAEKIRDVYWEALK